MTTHGGLRGSLVATLVLFGCGARTSLAELEAPDALAPHADVASDANVVDSAFVDDVAVDTDLPPPIDVSVSECARATDCTESAPGLSFCPPNRPAAWSCIAGYCTFECRPSRSCVRDAEGCFTCDDVAMRTCPGARCNSEFPIENGTPQRSTCARDYFRDIVRCDGDFVTLADGRVCTVEDLFTGVPRSRLMCGGCETLVIGG